MRPQAGPSYTPAVTNTTIAGRPAFATQDLFVRHPTDPGRWRVLGRADEQIMLSSGEKVGPQSRPLRPRARVID